MSISFANWHKAKRLKSKADLRALPRGALQKLHWLPARRDWRRAVPLLGFAAVVGSALAFALDRFEHGPTDQAFAIATPQIEVLRGQKDVRGQTGMPRGSSGVVTVIDGDTLQLGSERIRLHGMDAPESKQRCADGWQAGEEARRALSGLVSKGTPRCEQVTTDRYGRTVAICRVNGQDIAAAMVRSGQAWAYTKYSSRYVREEALARAEGIGVHARTCMQPADWRAQHQRQG